MKLDVYEISLKYEENSIQYVKYLQDFESNEGEIYAKRLYNLNRTLRKNPDFAKQVIDNLINSSNVGTVMNIALFAIDIEYNVDKALEKAMAIMNDNANGILCNYVKMSLMRMKKIS